MTALDARLAAVRRVDWRFLLPRPELGRVGCAGAVPASAAPPATAPKTHVVHDPAERPRLMLALFAVSGAVGNAFRDEFWTKEAGTLQTPTAVFPLEDVTKAHIAMEEGTAVGKIILKL